MSGGQDQVWYATQNDVAVVNLDRPPVNAIDLAVIERFGLTLDEVAHKSGLRGIVVTGAGANFCAGLDVKAVPGYGADQLRAMTAAINRTIAMLYGMPIPTVAAIRGAALGGGYCLALACDYRFAVAGNARVGLPEVTAGIPYPAAPLDLITQELEPGIRRRLALLGETFTGEQAKAVGLVDELVQDAELVSRAVETVLRLGRLPGYAAVKHQLRGVTVDRMRKHFETVDPLVGILLGARRNR